jgi:predicted nucleic acid-binding protein
MAFADRSDTYHRLFKQLFAHPPRLLTTSLIIGEGHAWFLRRYDRTRALQFLAMIEDMQPLKVAAVGSTDLAGATVLLRKFADQDLTVTDAVGLHVMKERRIRVCWSTGLHVALTGAKVII